MALNEIGSGTTIQAQLQPEHQQQEQQQRNQPAKNRRNEADISNKNWHDNGNEDNITARRCGTRDLIARIEV